ncbi:MAG TPA: N-methyl-L-tryptophan oxidase [Nitrososphaerales archaeon]|nr:N-methyl-L-tryptophan oxidase [Nitrososphaerales archaeon]
MSLSQTVKPPTENRLRRKKWDAIVVGCGIMGASVSYNLASRGLRVLNLERFGVNHKFGSSHGQTRIIRLAYYEDQRYVPLLRKAFQSWREAEARSGKRLLQVTGGLMIGREDEELVQGVLKSAKTHGLPHEVLSPAEAAKRFPAFTLGKEYTTVFEPNAGVLFAEECVRAFVGLASEIGCEFRFSEQVKGWKSDPEGIEVQTSNGTQAANKVVFCAGPWNGQLLRGLLPLQCERQVPLWFSSGGQDTFFPPKMPVFIMEEEKGVFYYGTPDVGHGVKVARTHGGEVSGPDDVRREVTERDVAPVRGFITRRMARLDGPPIASTICTYSNTPDLNFAVGVHPADSRIIVMSACSGHGFKFASVLGEVAADLATDRKVPFDISFLSPGRFARSGR